MNEKEILEKLIKLLKKNIEFLKNRNPSNTMLSMKGGYENVLWWIEEIKEGRM